MAVEDRLDRLEELSAYQERTIAQLNDALYEQQRELDTLRRDVKALAEKLKAMAVPVKDEDGREDPSPLSV